MANSYRSFLNFWKIWTHIWYLNSKVKKKLSKLPTLLNSLFNDFCVIINFVSQINQLWIGLKSVNFILQKNPIIKNVNFLNIKCRETEKLLSLLQRLWDKLEPKRVEHIKLECLSLTFIHAGLFWQDCIRALIQWPVKLKIQLLWDTLICQWS